MHDRPAGRRLTGEGREPPAAVARRVLVTAAAKDTLFALDTRKPPSTS
ncbi:hypothetical protein [Streptomyces cremeus]|uniref:Uncharacterized protein n=1 Tax=Streptomyces cremeus TaxID=66881 RepID=A0ABV5PKS4_STRCM